MTIHINIGVSKDEDKLNNNYNLNHYNCNNRICTHYCTYYYARPSIVLFTI